ncbi:WD40 repeat-like protein [Lichtheimia hyalospora FSU 10163]|nr:WD40 repeat-like protein [Lichtheimia hyalospora FSU 10163]
MTQVFPLIQRDLSFTPYSLQWVPSSARLCAVGATTRGAGIISVYRVNGKRLEIANETETPMPLRCCSFGAADKTTRHVATGDFDGRLQLWDTNRLEIPISSVNAHDTIINMVDGSMPELATASRDGCVKVWDTRQLDKAVFNVRHTEQQDAWSVAFGGSTYDNRLVAAGYENGDLELFDLAASQYLWKTNVGAGICSIDFNQDKLVLCTLSGLAIVNLTKSGTVEQLQSSSDTTMWAAHHVPQDPRYFGVVGGDGVFRLWDHDGTKQQPVASLSLSKHPIIACDWNRDKQGLVACASFDQTLRIAQVTF